MSYFNYRIVKHESEEGEGLYFIHEAYYLGLDQEVPVQVTENPVVPNGEDLDELIFVLEEMLEAARSGKKVLHAEDYRIEIWEKEAENEHEY